MPPPPARAAASAAAVLILLSPGADPIPTPTACFLSGTRRRRPSPPPRLLARYGPPEESPGDLGSDFWSDQEGWEREDEGRVARRASEFRRLLGDVAGAEDPDHLPGMMTRNVDLLLSMRGYEGVGLMRDALDEARASGDEDRARGVESAVDYILTFTEEFVEQARKIDDANKALLGRIVSAMTSGWDGHGDRPGRTDEAILDELLERERDNLTAGFVRHLEGECSRIAAAPRASREGARLLQTMRLLQARVLEELGRDLGEGAQVLGQLLGYEDRGERLAVLDAGLTVRGADFAEELAELTGEALGDFPKVPGGADPGLVRIVEEIDGRIREFIEASRSFQ